MPIDFLLLNKKKYNFLKFGILSIILNMALYSDNIAEKYSSYSYVLSEFDIENEYIYNQEFQSFVSKNKKSLTAFYQASLKRGKDIIPMMRNMLVSQGLSDLLIYLPMIESGFSTSALSYKKAAGVWQFMPKTAQEHNLVVNDRNDERYDILRATGAAIAYLDTLHKRFGKWYLAIMAYNCGEGRMSYAIKEANSDNLSVLLDKKRAYLPFETRQYIKKIISVAMIGEDRELNMDNKIQSLDDGVIEVEIASDTSLYDVAKLIGINKKIVENLNMNRKKYSKKNISKTRKIIIPVEKLFAFYLRYEYKSEKRVYKKYHLSHIVRLGETLETISKKYSTSSEEIMTINNLPDIFLTSGQMLIVPVDKKIFEQYQ